MKFDLKSVLASKQLVFWLCFSFLVIAGCFLFLSNLEGSLSLWDEAYYAAVSKGAYHHGLILFPATNPGERAAKSALFFWLADLSFLVFGVNGMALRLPSALGALGGVLFLYLIGNKLYGVRVGFVSALLLLTSREYHLYPRNTMHDPIMLAFQLGFVWCAIYGSETKRWRFVLGGALLGLAFFMKQILGLSVLAPVLFYWWWMKAWPVGSRKDWLFALLSFYVFGCGWYTVAGWYDFSHVKTLLFTYNLTERFTEQLGTDTWFWANFFTDPGRQCCHPIVYAGVFTFFWCVVEFLRKPDAGTALFGSWLWSLAIVLHLASFRAVHYGLPLYPAMCLFIALMAERFWTRDWNGIDFLAVGWSAAYLLMTKAPTFLAGIPFGNPLGKALVLGGLFALLFLSRWPIAPQVRAVAVAVAVALPLWLAAEVPPPADNGPETYAAIRAVQEKEGYDSTIHAGFFAYYHVVWYHDGPVVMVNPLEDSTLPIPEGEGYLFDMTDRFKTWPENRYELVADTGFFQMMRFHPATKEAGAPEI